MLMGKKILQKTASTANIQHIRVAQFFLSSKNYVPFTQDDFQNTQKSSLITSLTLECSGHGSFNQNAVADRFLSYLKDCIDHIKQLKKLKLKLSGFDLNKHPNLIDQIVKYVEKNIGDYNSLEIRMNNLKNCQLKDFQNILGLGVNITAQNLQNLSYQFSNWSFSYDHARQVLMKQYMDKKKGIQKKQQNKKQPMTEQQLKQKNKPLTARTQPTFKQFKQSLQKSIGDTIQMGKRLQNVKKFRLEISTWYYEQVQYQHFLSSIKQTDFSKINPTPTDPNQIQYFKNDLTGKKITSRQSYFHNQFTILIKKLLQYVMTNLTNLQLDLRNWNKKFEMNNLKGSLANINNQSKQSAVSQITLSKRLKMSKRQVVKQKLDSIIVGKEAIKEEQREDDDKQEPKVFDILIII